MHRLHFFVLFLDKLDIRIQFVFQRSAMAWFTAILLVMDAILEVSPECDTNALNVTTTISVQPVIEKAFTITTFYVLLPMNSRKSKYTKYFWVLVRFIRGTPITAFSFHCRESYIDHTILITSLRLEYFSF